MDRTDKVVPLFKQRKFTFTEKCVYGAMSSGSEQVQRIDAYVDERGIPVYYALYNPPNVPSSGLHPASGGIKSLEDNEVGCRVLKREEVNDILDELPVGTTPSFGEMQNPRRKTSSDPHAVQGWRLETFIADEVMRCREGRLFEDTQDETLASLLYRRTAPIAAAIVMTVDLPEDELAYD